MSAGPERFQELVERVLATGGSDAQRAELAAWIERDPALREEFLRRTEIYHLLPLALEEERDAERFLDSIRARLQAKGDSQAFLAATRQRILRAGAGASRRRSGWVAAGIAAAALLAGGIWVYVGSRPTVHRPPSAAVKEPVPPVKEQVSPRPPEEPKVALPEPKPVPVPVPERKLPPPPPPAPKSEPTPKPPAPPPVIVEAPRKAPEPPKAPALPSPYFATLEKVDGKVAILSGPLQKPATAGKNVFRRRGLQTGAGKSGAVVRYPDGTQVELAPGTVIWDVSDRPTSPEEPAKRILVAQGEVLVSVSKQPAARPMVLLTPHGEAEVLGTVFRLQVRDVSTQIDMGEGRVRLTRKEDGKSVEVAAGFTATIAEGIPFAAIRRRAAFSGTPSKSKTNR